MMVTLTKENVQPLDIFESDNEKTCIHIGFPGNQPFGPILVPVKFVPMSRQGDGTAVDGISHIHAEPITKENPGSNGRLVSRPQGLTPDGSLSRRELEIVRHIAKGSANKQIGYQLNISEQTVRNHVTSILRKLDAKNRAHIVTLAICRGVIPLWELGSN